MNIELTKLTPRQMWTLIYVRQFLYEIWTPGDEQEQENGDERSELSWILDRLEEIVTVEVLENDF